jgi:hypothetical protein
MVCYSVYSKHNLSETLNKMVRVLFRESEVFSGCLFLE